VTSGDAFFTKSSDWIHEKEWRRYRLIRDADRTIEVDGETIALFSFPRNAIRSVILGMDIAEADLKLLQRALLFPTDYRHKVTVFNCGMDSRSYRLRLSQVRFRH